MARELTTQSPNSVWDFMSEVEKVFDDLWSRPSEGGERAGRSMIYTPAVDLRETDDFYLVSVDVPGVNPNEIKIQAQDGRLMISGERKVENKRVREGFQRIESQYGSFSRIFQLPQNIDQEKIQARTENGVLEIMVPKSAVAKPHQIQINAEKGGLFSRVLGQKNVESTSSKTEEATRLKEKH